ncbi:multidrug efflux SMR transporter [Methyloceanibacter sp.]|uniref:DMT family transporter n=1 Tax=Methyloceanibacter sp. TaxID=1965321 RepID=UPI00351BCD2D
MAWTYLILAGLCEVVYAALLKKTQGFTQSLPTALFLVAVVSIFVLLALAAREIPIGTAYAVYPPSVSPARQRLGIVLYHEPATALRLFFLVTLIGSIIGLKLATPT